MAFNKNKSSWNAMINAENFDQEKKMAAEFFKLYQLRIPFGKADGIYFFLFKLCFILKPNYYADGEDFNQFLLEI